VEKDAQASAVMQRINASRTMGDGGWDDRLLVAVGL
jgi:hypothetical protein